MRAMWADPGVKPLWEQRRDASGKVPFMMEKVGDTRVPYLTSEEMHAVASILESRHFSGTRLAELAGSEGDLAAAIARVESAWQPLAHRYETKLGEASTGLMQVLQSTAKWLEQDMGYRAYTVDPSNPFLYRPFEATYYGMAYHAWLSNYKGIPRSEEFVVRGYNGGPGGWEIPATEKYWSKYLQAKQEILPSTSVPSPVARAPAPRSYTSICGDSRGASGGYPNGYMDKHGDRGPINVIYWDDWTDGEDMRAMWADPSVKVLWEQRREASGKVPFKMEKVGGKSVPHVGLEEIHAATLVLLRRHFSGRGKRLWPTGLASSEGDAVLAVCAVARVESAWQPLAYRFEPRLGEASIGLMQVLQSSAEWLARDMGYRAYAADVASSMIRRPFAGLYYGMAYLAWLTTYKGISRSEEFVVRAYHGGPGRWNKGLQHGTGASTGRRRRYPVIQPDTKHTKLKVSQEGLSVIRSIKNPIAIVAVIGPYRSGKSFLLNQLLTLTCDEGFGVGHARDTKTKGIWVWGDPMEMQVNGQTTSVLFLDTEGFESVGKSSVYDDRIFALATVLSSVLIYNLAETVKEADIAKLSFAVELAEEFYGRWEMGKG
ncbi:unnamed protein product [Closterium sp. Yama58-4]|nr:unnamed protein product [Closterium sp. Yama58-4]